MTKEFNARLGLSVGQPPYVISDANANLTINTLSTAGNVEVGSPGTETSGVNVGGTIYSTLLRASDIGGNNPAQLVMHRHSTTWHSIILGSRSNSDTTSHANVTTGQALLTMYAAGYAGSNYKLFGSMSVQVDTGTVSDTSAPGKIVISVTPDGTTTLTDVAVFNSSGLNSVNIGASTRGTGAFTTLLATGQVTANAGIASTSTTTGTAVITGGLGVSGNIYAGNISTTGFEVVGGDLTVVGNATVQGTTYLVDVTTYALTSPVVDLGTGPNNSPLTSDDGLDRGLLFHYYKASTDNHSFLGFRSADLKLIYLVNVQPNSGNTQTNPFTGTAGAILGDFEIGNIFANVSTVATSTTSGAIRTPGGVGIGGNLYVGGNGVITGTLSATNLSGTNTGDQTITLTGDVTGSGTGSFTATLANSGVTAGTYGNSTYIPQITVDSKGRATNIAAVAISSLPVTSLAAFTSAQLAGLVTDETGSGNLVFNTNPTLSSPAITGGTINNATIGATTPNSAIFTTVAATGQVTANAAISSTSTITGTIVVTGGVGISGNLNVGGNISAGNISGTFTGAAAQLTITDNPTTNSTFYPLFSTGTGAQTIYIDSSLLSYNPSFNLLSTGNVSLSGNLTTVDNITVNGIIGIAANGDINLYRASPGAALNWAPGGSNGRLIVANGNQFTFSLDGGSTTPITFGTNGQITANYFVSTVATGTAPMTVSSTTKVANLNADYLDDIDSVNLSKQYTIPDTSNIAGWIKLGTFTAGQTGNTIAITMVTHAGFNASIAQNQIVDIFFKTSNGPSLDVNGFAGDSMWRSRGENTSVNSIKWVSNAAGNLATSFDLYANVGSYTLSSFYTVNQTTGTWTHLGLTGQSDPGVGSNTVCVSTAENFITTPTTITTTLAVGSTVTASRLISNIATGTAPLTVSSTTAVTNLNADMTDGYHASTAATATTLAARDSAANITTANIVLTGTSPIDMTAQTATTTGVLFDTNAVKRITWNDGVGNWNFRAGHYVNGVEVYVNDGTANGGASAQVFTCDGADGAILWKVAATGVSGANVTWAQSMTLSTTGLSMGTGNITAGNFLGTASAALYSDLAEKYVADAPYEFGTVLEFGGVKEVTIAQNESYRVAGVVSHKPAYIMNSNLKEENTVAIALQGRVPCKVKGDVSKGDMMISAGGGYAKASDNPELGQVIGKALENFNGDEGMIEVVIGRI